MAKRGTALLEEPERGQVPRSSPRDRPLARRDLGDDFARDYPRDHAREFNRLSSARQPTLKVKLRTRLPTSLAGRIATGVALLLLVAGFAWLLMVTRTFLVHDARFTVATGDAIELEGNRHLTRAELLDLFADDLGRNIFRLSLVERQAQLEARPWVEHATVMRLLPGRIRVAIVERVPVAFVRQGRRIALVDAHGVLLEMRAADARLSFPVLTGIAAQDPASTRAARMKIFGRFLAELDSGGQKVSETLGEVDLSDPEDVRALLPVEASEVLVHFGGEHFLERYRAFEQHLPEWHRLYPKLASVDLRYKDEYVLDPVGLAPAKANVASVKGEPALPHAVPRAGPAVAKPAAALGRGPVAAAARTPAAAPRAVGHPAATIAAHAATLPAARPSHAAAPPLQAAAPPLHAAAPLPHPAAAAAKPSAPASAAAPSASEAARAAYQAKPSAGKPLPVPVSDVYHPPQVPTR